MKLFGSEMILPSRKRIQQLIYLVIFLNSMTVMIVTCISMTSEHWVVARPYRQVFLDAVQDLRTARLKSTSNTSSRFNLTTNNQTNENKEEDEDEDDDDFWPIDLYEKNDCKRYNGKIRFGLFRGVWMFNYAYGCKNRIHRAYSKYKKLII